MEEEAVKAVEEEEAKEEEEEGDQKGVRDPGAAQAATLAVEASQDLALHAELTAFMAVEQLSPIEQA